MQFSLIKEIKDQYCVKLLKNIFIDIYTSVSKLVWCVCVPKTITMMYQQQQQKNWSLFFD